MFIKKTGKGYRQVYPAVWNGKYNLRNMFLGRDFMKSFIWFVIILFLAWSYFNDVDAYQEFYEEIIADPVEFCANVNMNDYNTYGENTFTLSDNDG